MKHGRKDRWTAERWANYRSWARAYYRSICDRARRMADDVFDHNATD